MTTQSAKPSDTTDSPGAGHNSTGGVAAGQLRAFVARIERLEEEKKTLNLDIKEIYAEAGGGGFDKKILRKLIAIRKIDTATRQEEQTILDLYLRAMGESLLGGTD